MDTLLWIVAGGLLGWMSFTILSFNEARGLVVSIGIGAIGALVGAKAIAPVFITSASSLDELSAPRLLFAAGAAAFCLAFANLLHRRWDL